jgi:hypothetical protein
MATPQMSFRLHVADYGLNGGATSVLAFDTAKPRAFGPF